MALSWSFDNCLAILRSEGPQGPSETIVGFQPVAENTGSTDETVGSVTITVDGQAFPLLLNTTGNPVSFKTTTIKPGEKVQFYCPLQKGVTFDSDIQVAATISGRSIDLSLRKAQIQSFKKRSRDLCDSTKNS